MRQAARRTYRIACPTGRPGCRENHPLPGPLPAPPTTRLIHTSRLSPAPRSEERRVGKECSSRWEPDDENNEIDQEVEQNSGNKVTGGENKYRHEPMVM